MRPKSQFLLFGFVVAAALGAAPAMAAEAVLAVGGEIRDKAERLMTRSEIEALGVVQITTTTPWHDGAVTFDGVPMTRLMDAIGAAGSTAVVVALNDYTTEIPVSDFERFEPILAYKQDGRYMEVANKGPFFIIYPYDDNPELQSEIYYSRSAWQVRSIEIE